MSKKNNITPESSLKKAWNEVLNEVRKAISEAQHPFRYVTLATVDNMNSPQQRMVVLRDFNEKSEFLIYTDSRSDKVAEIMKNNSVSLLFYHSEMRLQLRVTGSAAIIQSGEEFDKEWDSRGSKSPHSYTSVLSPGT
ncbi:MAG: pyridoxamine 5'-phosphate oxidase family protein [Balneolaceae bacterium]|nr:pyridoxamine 5'-phosphate oxidase family protein [Balneolaceae bacterium]